jgi:hypothetical protein
VNSIGGAAFFCPLRRASLSGQARSLPEYAPNIDKSMFGACPTMHRTPPRTLFACPGRQKASNVRCFGQGRRCLLLARRGSALHHQCSELARTGPELVRTGCLPDLGCSGIVTFPMVFLNCHSLRTPQ